MGRYSLLSARNLKMSNFWLKDQIWSWEGGGMDFWKRSKMKQTGFHLLTLELVYSVCFLPFFVQFKWHSKHHVSYHSIQSLKHGCALLFLSLRSGENFLQAADATWSLFLTLGWGQAESFVTHKALWLSKWKCCRKNPSLLHCVVHWPKFATCSH